MPLPVTEHVAHSARHTTGYLACGPEDGPLIVFVHGWPELSLSWRHQLPHFGALGFRAVAPDMRGYADALKRNGFFGPDSWYMNAERNIAFASQAKNNGRIDLPVLFLHAAYDWVCETRKSRLAEPMRANCSNLTEATTNTGHWMAQEDPAFVNAEVARWLEAKLPGVWSSKLASA